MTAAAYTTDLATVHLAETGGGTWLPSTAAGWTATGSVVNETDYFIQGVSCTSRNMKAGVGACMTPAVANFTVPTDGAILVWLKCDAPNCLSVESSGGIRLMLGNSQAVFLAWKLLGSDSYPFGGWVCLAANNTVSADYTLGAPASPWQMAGAAVNMPTAYPAKGNPFGVDAIRVGRCEARFAGGTTPDAACTFASFAAINDSNTAGAYNRWGLLQAIAGGFLWQGLMVIGYGAACRLTDSNVSITIANTKKVTAAFNRIEIRNANTEVNWTNISFLSLGTVSKGQLEVVDDCDVNIASCTFQLMSTFVWKAGSDILTSRFIGCGQITANGAKFNGTVFSGYEPGAESSCLLWNTAVDTNGRIDNCTFTKGTAASHALELANTAQTSFTLTGVSFNGYNAANGQTDSAIWVRHTAGTVTINCSGTPSYKSDGATVNIVSGSKTCSVAVTDIDGAAVNGARVMVRAKDATQYPYNESVTITNNGSGTATVSHTGHRMATGDKVQIHGASLWQNNGIFTITKVNDNSYTYSTLPETPGSNPAGTITATYVLLHDVTSGGSPVTMNRVFSGDFDVVGWARKSSAQPYYKSAPISGRVTSANGWTGSAVLIADE